MGGQRADNADIDDDQPGADLLAEHRHRGASSTCRGDHLRGDGLRPRRDTSQRDTVVGSEDDDDRM